jgi:hypothetical protein
MGPRFRRIFLNALNDFRKLFFRSRLHAITPPTSRLRSPTATTADAGIIDNCRRVCRPERYLEASGVFAENLRNWVRCLRLRGHASPRGEHGHASVTMPPGTTGPRLEPFRSTMTKPVVPKPCPSPPCTLAI